MNVSQHRVAEQGPAETSSAVYIQAAIATLIGMTAIIITFRTGDLIPGSAPASMWLGLLIFTGVSGLALTRLPTYPHSQFGAANSVTMLRAAATAAIGGIVLGSDSLPTMQQIHLQWIVVSGAAISLILDGADGYLARRNKTESRFGARFDMEVDALLILFLAIGAALSAKAGVWVLLIGLMRYAFIIGQMTFKRLQGDLPPSMRRKIVCVVQGGALCMALAPVTPPMLGSLVLSVALVLLRYSFTVDIAYLWEPRERHCDEA
ncbi:MAG TPA: CDP-alcohol phosphatidyltransferase family protein [Pseudorhizobium sp.]|nr:CDP-alcohol phosphatidyltransferase family protein [Pseudorhizobium sp.]